MVLVHGAFGRAACWDRVAPGLRAAGHDVEAIDLPGAGDDTTPAANVTLAGYARRVCEALSDGPPAVLVGHSMGGMVITQAAARCPDRIEKLVYVAAFVPWDGMSLIDMTRLPEAAGDLIQGSMIVEGDPPIARMSADGARAARYGCCDDEQVAYALARNSPQAAAPFTHPVRLEGRERDAFAGLPRAYVMCLQDMAIRPRLQRLMIERAACDPVIEIDTDHAVWASRPDELVVALNRLAA
jgi:pimeloyl-ACP methyl ester carboxylesterase